MLVSALLAAALIPASALGLDRSSTEHSLSSGDTPNMDPSEALEGLSIRFEENQGQFPDHVRYKVHGAGMHAFLTDKGVGFVLTGPGEQTRQEEKGDFFNQSVSDILGLPRKGIVHSVDPIERTAHAVFLEFQDANPNPRMEGFDEQDGISNYFIGNDPDEWVTEVSHFGRVIIQEVWPGIDIEWHAQGGKGLKFDVHVNPGADPERVAFTVDGAEDVYRDGEGNLNMHTPLGSLIKDAPYSYQATSTGGVKAVESWYEVDSSGVVTINWAENDYDDARKLIIDPLVYSTYLGGSGLEWRNSAGRIDEIHREVAVDGDGHAYVTGESWSSDFPTTAGAFQITHPGGDSAAVVTKLTPSGDDLIYSTYLGGSDLDFGRGVAVGADNQAFLTGWTESSDFPITVTARQPVHPGGEKAAFVTKLAPRGDVLVFSTYLGGDWWDLGIGIAVDASGHAYVTGATWSWNFPTTISLSSFRGNAAFVTKITPSGGLVYSTTLSGSGEDWGLDVAVDREGHAFITGGTESLNFPTTSGAFQTSYPGGDWNGFVAKISSLGNSLLYSTFLGGGDSGVGDGGVGIAVDRDGHAYVTGQTWSSDFPTTPGALQTTRPGGLAGYVAKITPLGDDLIYSTYLGGGFYDWGLDIAVDAGGHTFVTGITWSSNFPTTSGAFQTSHASYPSARDAFVTKLTPSGDGLVYSTYLGGSDDDRGVGITVDSSGLAYVIGITDSSDFPTTSGAFESSHQGNSDMFITKIHPLQPHPADVREPIGGCSVLAADWTNEIACLRDHVAEDEPEVVWLTQYGEQSLDKLQDHRNDAVPFMPKRRGLTLDYWY